MLLVLIAAIFSNEHNPSSHVSGSALLFICAETHNDESQCKVEKEARGDLVQLENSMCC